MKNNFNFAIALFFISVLVAVSSFRNAEQSPTVSDAYKSDGYSNVQLKSFGKLRTIEEAESLANEWLKQNRNYKVISVMFTTTPEPEKYYPPETYPGFKYDMVITYRK